MRFGDHFDSLVGSTIEIRRFRSPALLESLTSVKPFVLDSFVDLRVLRGGRMLGGLDIGGRYHFIAMTRFRGINESAPQPSFLGR